MADVFELRYRGYVSARKRHELNLDELNSSSSEWSIDPIRQKLVRRGGSKIIEDTVASLVGLLETSFSGRAEFAGGIHSPSFTLDYSSPAYLITNETTKKGAFGWIDRNQAGSTACHKQIGSNFGSTHYSTASGTETNMKIPPVWFENSTTPLGRWKSTTQRELSAAGARNFIEVGNRLYLPNAQGTPLWWNKTFSASSSTGTSKERIFPWGNLMPLSVPSGQLTAAGGTGDNNWKDGDSFFVSAQFEYEDGSLSIPFIPRPAGNITAGGTTITTASLVTANAVDCRCGQVLVGTIGGSAFYKSITWSNIPYGPDGVKYVRLLRSDKVNLASSSTPFTAAPLELFLIARLPNGTTTYIDTGADNGTLTPDQRITDSLLSIWAPRAQYAIGADSRVVLGGNIQIHPAAIVIAPISINNAVTAGWDMNHEDTSSSIFGSTQVFVTVSSTELKLKLVASGGAFPAAITSTITITLTNKTLQEVVDEINQVSAVLTAPVRARWGAQLVPGVDGTILSTSLADTTGADYFGDDGMLTAGGTGNMRCFAPTYPGILYFSQAYLATFKADTQGLCMSSASPTVPGGNANSFFSDKSTNWKYPPSATCGRLMGLVPITGRGGIVCLAVYEKGWYVLRNTVGGGSGQDADYHLVSLDEYDGCVSHRTCIAGPGVAGCMSQQGFSLTDGESKVLISRDIWDNKLQQGEFGAEMLKAIPAAAAGNQAHYLAAKLLGTKLAITYRSDTSLTYADRRIEYEFGEGTDSLGLAGMLRQSDQGRPSAYGWSAPVKAQKVSVMGRYENATGAHNFGLNESATGSTGDGRIDEFDTGTTDNAGGYGSAAGTAWTSDAYSASIVAPLHKFISLVSLAFRYIKNASGLTITIYGDGPTNQGARSDSVTLTVGSSGSNLYGELQSNIPVAMSGNYSVVEFKVTDDGSGSTAPIAEALDVKYELHERTVVT